MNKKAEKLFDKWDDNQILILYNENNRFYLFNPFDQGEGDYIETYYELSSNEYRKILSPDEMENLIKTLLNNKYNYHILQ